VNGALSNAVNIIWNIAKNVQAHAVFVRMSAEKSRFNQEKTYN
jgi:hypothetical protein